MNTTVEDLFLPTIEDKNKSKITQPTVAYTHFLSSIHQISPEAAGQMEEIFKTLNEEEYYFSKNFMILGKCLHQFNTVRKIEELVKVLLLIVNEFEDFGHLIKLFCDSAEWSPYVLSTINKNKSGFLSQLEANMVSLFLSNAQLTLLTEIKECLKQTPPQT